MQNISMIIFGSSTLGDAICDPLSENPICLHNSVLEINAIEIHWVKNACYINNFYVRFKQ